MFVPSSLLTLLLASFAAATAVPRTTTSSHTRAVHHTSRPHTTGPHTACHRTTGPRTTQAPHTSTVAHTTSAPHTTHKHALAQVVTSCIVPNTVALTFDDGPWKYMYNISKTLIAADAKGTFFFNGDNWECIYDEDAMKRVKYAYRQGHQVASHTWSHAHLPSLSWDKLHDEFYRVEQALARITGATPAFARPPYGEYNDMVREVAQARGQTLVNWDFDSGDSVGKTAQESMRMYDKLVREHPDTILALHHEVYEDTAHIVLPHAIKVLQDAGYKLVTLAECLGMPAYQTVGEPEVDDGSWTC